MMPTIQQRAASIFAGLTFRLVLLGVIGLLLLNTYGDFAIKGPLGIGFHFEGWKPKAQRLQGVIDMFDKAQDDALAAAELAKAKAEADYRNLAERIDDEAEEIRDGAMADAERFIAANRVRCPADRGPARGPVAAAGDRSAGDGQGAGPSPELDAAGLVAVPEADIRICTVNTLQAEAARAWAIGLEAASR